MVRGTPSWSVVLKKNIQRALFFFKSKPIKVKFCSSNHENMNES